MGLIAKIKEIIYKVKDYDRLESDYCTVLDMVTGARLSKPNYTMDAVREAFNEFLDEHDKEVYKPAETVEKILNRIEKDATWLVISVYKNGRGWQLFREGYKIDEEDLTERERDWLESWVFAAYNGGLFQKRKATDIFTNHPDPHFRPPCKNGDPCHEKAPRGSKTGLQGIKDKALRSAYPQQLCEHIVDICEELYAKR